jgi:hypothetical protein
LGRFSASRRICSSRSLLILFLFTVLLESSSDSAKLGADVTEHGHDSEHLFPVDQRFGVDPRIVAAREATGKMAGRERGRARRPLS